MIYTGQLLTAIIQQVSFNVNSLNSLIKFIKAIFITEYTDPRLLEEVGDLTESVLDALRLLETGFFTKILPYSSQIR
jgi:hypothetical protein